MSFQKSPRRRAAVLLVIGASLLTTMITRGSFANIRAIDAVSLFAIGMTCGASIANFRRSFEHE